MTAKLSTLVIPFSGSSLPSTLYTEPDAGSGEASGTVTVSDGELLLDGGNYSDSGYYTSVNSEDAYDLTSSAGYCKVLPDTSSGDYDTGWGLYASNFSDGYTIGCTGGKFYVQKWSGGDLTTLFSTTYSATSHAWMQITESGGTISFQTSATGESGSWATQYTTSTETVSTWTATDSYVQFYYGSASGDAKPSGSGGFSSFNVAPSGGGGSGSGTFTATTTPILGMYETDGAFPTPGPSAWPSGPTTNMTATYMAWGQDWSTYAGAFITECAANGLTPYVELEPWESGSSWDTDVEFSTITGGTWDSWLEEIGTSIAASGQPCILTFAHEFNISGQYPWSQGDTGDGTSGGAVTASEWITTWEYVRNKVSSTANGLALWMWAPGAYTGGSTISPAAYWPGASNVDMVGIDGYPNTEYGEDLGTFSGQLQPTVTIIRGLGWTDPIFISETNLAQMVSSGGESITDFVADMYAAGISGILEFEDATWDLPAMTSEQWTEYNDAVAANYGTGGGGGSGGGGSFTAAGSWIETTGTSFTWQPAAEGNVLVVIALSVTEGDPVTALSSSNATWERLVSDQTLGSTTVTEATAFLGTATSTASETVTLTTSATAGNLRVLAHEFDSGGQAVALDTFVTMNGDASGDVTAWPPVTPARGGSELLLGYERNLTGDAVAGTTAGVTYVVDAEDNGGAYDLSVSGATAVGWGDSDARTALVLLLYAGSGQGASSGLLMVGIA